MTESESTPVIAAVLTLNEEDNIGRCLASLGEFDGIYVVDSGSSDATVSIARDLGAHVLIHRQAGAFDIAAQRNYLLDREELPEGVWVFFLDADEEVPSDTATRILEAARSDRHVAYELSPKYLFQGEWMRRSMGYPNWHPRLARKGSVRFAGGVWEHFDTTGTVGRIDAPYLHHGNSKGFRDWLERHDRYSTWEAESVVAFLRSHKRNAFRTSRRLTLRVLAARLWPLRPYLRFAWMYFLRLGFLDGPAAFRFCLRYAMYEFMTSEKIAEDLRRARGLDL